MSDNFAESEKKSGSYYNHPRTEMLKFIPPNTSTVLDVGCGEGHFGRIIKTTFSAEVWGAEINGKAAEKAREVLDKVFIGSIEKGEIILPHDYFDCILFNDVLEHFCDPWKVLMDIKKHLKEGGVIVASIPNVRFIQNVINLVIRGNWDYVDEGILDRTHLRFFTKNSIAKMFEKSGYEIMALEGINGGRFPWKFGLLNFALLNLLDDMRYLQYACVVRKKEK